MPVKSRSTTKVQAGPVSCDMALSGPGLVLDADAFTVPTVLGTAAPGLSLTGGYRAGHSALLSPDQDVLLVVGGQILQADDTAAVDAWRTCWPLLEGFHFRLGLWFLPSGQLLQSTAMQGGSVCWPGQSATAVLWDVPPPPPASEKTSMLNNNVSGVPELPSPCGEKAAVITAPTSEKPAVVVNATPPPATAHLKRSASRKKLGAPPLAAKAAEKVAPETASAPPAPPPSPPQPDPPPAWMSVSPTEVVVVGGWDGVKRLATVMSYSTGVTPPDASPLDLDYFSSLPTVTELPQLPALSHHTATIVRDRLYVYGGNTLQGCSDALFVVDGGHLQHAYEEQQTRLLVENSRQFGNPALARNARLGAALPPKELTNVLESAREGRPTSSSWSCGRVQWPPVQEEPAITSVSEGATAVRSSTSNMGNSANRSPPRAIIVPRPAPRSSHCACCLYNRFLIIFGGRQLVLPEAGGSAGHFHSTGHGSAAKAAPKKAPKPKRGGSRGKGYTVVDEGPHPALALLNDVAAFDCEEQMWVQVRITGGEAPAPRYGAAMCTILPEGLPPNLTREIVLHGGIGAGEEPLQDMWVLSAVATGGVGKNGAVKTLLEEDPRCGAPTLQMRWVRVRTERHDAAPTDGPEVAHGVLPSLGVATAAAGTVTSSVGSAEVVKPSPILARALHALVCTRSREVYVVGGVPGVGSDPPPLTCVKLPSLAVATEVPIPQAGKRRNSGSARRR